MKKYKLLTMSAFIISSLSMHVWAVDEDFPEDEEQTTTASDTIPDKKLVRTSDVEDSLNPWTDCGIGAMIFDETKWAAVTSNIIWDYGITATTSAVSTKDSCTGKQVEAALFINNTYSNLEEETASGGGKHITAMLDILGCDSSTQKDIIQAIRNDFTTNVADANYETLSRSDKAQQYYFLVGKKVSGQFVSQCGAS